VSGLPPAVKSESEIRDWCIAYIGQSHEIAATDISPNNTFAEMGIDSAAAAYFIVELEEWLGFELYPEIVGDHPTITDLAQHIANRDTGG
jgi:acyl carrier protein